MDTKRSPKILIGICLVLILAAISLIGACAQPAPAPAPTPAPAPAPASAPPKEIPETKLSYGGTITASSYYPFQSTLAEVWSKHPKITVAIESYGGGLECIEALDRHEFDFAQSTMEGAAQGYYALADYGFTAPKYQDIRGLSVQSVSPLGHVVLDSIKSWKDLEGKTVALSTGTGGAIIKGFMRANNIQNIDWVLTLDTEVIIEKLKRGEYAAYLGKGGISDAQLTRIMTEVPNTYLLESPKEMIELTAKKYPGQATPMIIPANAFPRQPKDIQSFVYSVFTFVRKEVPVDVVYEISKLTEENKDFISKSSAVAKAFPNWAKDTVDYAQIPLHPGVIKFLREDLGMTIPENLIPTEMK